MRVQKIKISQDIPGYQKGVAYYAVQRNGKMTISRIAPTMAEAIVRLTALIKKNNQKTA